MTPRLCHDPRETAEKCQSVFYLYSGQQSRYAAVQILMVFDLPMTTSVSKYKEVKSEVPVPVNLDFDFVHSSTATVNSLGPDKLW